MKDVSNAFQCFMEEAPAQAHAWMEAVQKLGGTSALDKKTEAIAYLSVLAAVGLLSGIPFHVVEAKALGTTRDEIKSAVLLSLPAVGNKCVAALPVALAAFDEENKA
jgi:alkylhydroperoxidase/carboxymuconolactone decarboxylase family protein YurZ